MWKQRKRKNLLRGTACEWQSWDERPDSLVSKPVLLLVRLNHSCEVGSEGCKPTSYLSTVYGTHGRIIFPLVEAFGPFSGLSEVSTVPWKGLSLAICLQGQLCQLYTSSVTSLQVCFSFVSEEKESLFIRDFAGSSAFGTSLGTGHGWMALSACETPPSDLSNVTSLQIIYSPINSQKRWEKGLRSWSVRLEMDYYCLES